MSHIISEPSLHPSFMDPVHRTTDCRVTTADPVIVCLTRGQLPSKSAFSSLMIKSPSDQSSSQLIKLDYRSTTIFCLTGVRISNTIPFNLVNFIKTVV